LDKYLFWDTKQYCIDYGELYKALEKELAELRRSESQWKKKVDEIQSNAQSSRSTQVCMKRHHTVLGMPESLKELTTEIRTTTGTGGEGIG
jgi:transposase